MSSTRTAGERAGIPISGRYQFTRKESETLRRRLNVAVLMKDRQLYPDALAISDRRDDEIAKVLWSVRTGMVMSFAPASLLRDVYVSAWTAYRAGIAIGKSQEEARRSAVVCAQFPLDKWFGIGIIRVALDREYLSYLDEHFFGSRRSRA